MIPDACTKWLSRQLSAQEGFGIKAISNNATNPVSVLAGWYLDGHENARLLTVALAHKHTTQAPWTPNLAPTSKHPTKPFRRYLDARTLVLCNARY